ncbi:hypothetical protein Tco_0362642 [Tanacetum coccineum]
MLIWISKAKSSKASVRLKMLLVVLTNSFSKENLYKAVLERHIPKMKTDITKLNTDLKSLTTSSAFVASSTSSRQSEIESAQAIMALDIAKIKTSFQDMIQLLYMAVSAGKSSASLVLWPHQLLGENPTEIVFYKPLTTIYISSNKKSPFIESPNPSELAFIKPNPNAMVIYQNPSSTPEGEIVWDYEVPKPIFSFKPITTENIPSFSTTQPSKDFKGKKKMFRIEDIIKVTKQELSELLEAKERKKKLILDDVASTKEIAKVANEEVKANKQVFRTTREFRLLQLQRLKAAKEKLKEKAVKRKKV